MAATVQGSELTKVYQLGNELVYALNRASLEVYPGELLAVVGRAGSGKSTLLHVLGCLQRPDAGSMRVEGQDVTELAEEELAEVRTRKVGFVFQAYNLLPNETMLGNVLVSLRHGDLDSYDRREKAVIFADEPTRALDSTSREEVMGLLQRLNSEGRTIVVSTDDSGGGRLLPEDGADLRREDHGGGGGRQKAGYLAFPGARTGVLLLNQRGDGLSQV